MGKKTEYKSLIEPTEIGPNYVITNVAVFDGIDSVLLMNQDVHIEDGWIVAMGNSLTIPLDFETIDGTGKYLLPGFIDSHVHMMASGSAPWAMIRPNPEHNLEAWLAAGITSIYDLGGIASQSKKYKKKIENGELMGPHVYYTGSPITAPNGHPIVASKALLPFPLSLFVGFLIETADEKTNVKKLIAECAVEDVNYIKIINDQLPEGISQINPNVMKALVDESHASGFKVFIHIGDSDDIESAVASGGDVLAHFPYRDALDESMVQKIKDNHVKMIYTIIGFENTYQMSIGNYIPSQLDNKLHPASLLDPVTGEMGKHINSTAVLDQFSQTLVENHVQWKNTFKELRKSEISFAIGTDSPLPGSYPGSSFHEEMRMLYEIGYSEYEILKAATSVAAGLFLTDPKFGRINIAQMADLVLLKSNPLEDIKNTMDIELIIKSGQVYRPTW